MIPSSFCVRVRRSAVLALLVLAGWMTGCRPEQDPFLDLVESQLGTRQISDLERTMALAASDLSYDNRQYEEKISGGLNRWINRVIEDGGTAADDSQAWKPEPTVAELVREYEAIPAVAAFDDREYVATDPYFVRGRSWMKSIARRVCGFNSLVHFELPRLQAGDFKPAEDDPAVLSSLMTRLHPDLAKEDASKLADAYALFDWTVRNIQLEDAAPPSDEDASARRLTESAGASLAAAGVPGPGFRRFVWQVLVYGRGDFLEKARLFAGLCRQREIETVMLYCGDQPWLVAAVVGGQAWLFDPRLGLPVPGKEPGQIATLTDVRANPELIEQLNLTVEESSREGTGYPIRPDQLASLRGELLVSPESLSRRMKFLEDRLIGDQRLLLFDDVARATAAVQQAIPDLPLTLSRLDFDAHRFRMVVTDALQRATFDEVLAERLTWYYTEESYIDQFVDYRSARNLFFIGRFETERNSRRMSAVSGFFSLFYTDDLITNIATDELRLVRWGKRKGPEQTAAEFQQEILGVQASMRLVRRDVGVFLAQSHFDHGNVSSAGNWLNRLQQRDDTGRWKPIMKYLEGRSLEAIRDYLGAIEAWRLTEGPQYPGNILRGRLLEQAVKAAGYQLVRRAPRVEEKPNTELPTNKPNVPPKPEDAKAEGAKADDAKPEEAKPADGAPPADSEVKSGEGEDAGATAAEPSTESGDEAVNEGSGGEEEKPAGGDGG